MQSFDVAVGLRPAGADAGVADSGREACAEDVAAEFVAVVGQHPLEPPACRFELGGDAARERGGVLAGGPAVAATTSSAQAKDEVSIAVSCQTGPLTPCSRPT